LCCRNVRPKLSRFGPNVMHKRTTLVSPVGNNSVPSPPISPAETQTEARAFQGEQLWSVRIEATFCVEHHLMGAIVSCMRIRIR
jgi:hypothetical protein